MIRMIPILVGALALAGCESKIPRYYVTAQQSEAIPDRLDGRWFTREVQSAGALGAVELVYCPMLADAPDGELTVCRTAVVWEGDVSELTDGPPKDAEAKKEPPAAAPPAPTPAAGTP